LWSMVHFSTRLCQECHFSHWSSIWRGWRRILIEK
jgi:hypothetical protein